MCLALVQVQDQPVPLDFTALANAGITVLVRIGYGYADGTGTIAPPDRLAAFEDAVAQTLNNAQGVTASHYCNEINNASEAPGWNPEVNAPGPDYFALTPDYYIQSYNRVWYKIGTAVKLGPAPLDPYYGPPFPYLKYSSNNRDWWTAIMNGIAGSRCAVPAQQDAGQQSRQHPIGHALWRRTVDVAVLPLPHDRDGVAQCPRSIQDAARVRHRGESADQRR